MSGEIDKVFLQLGTQLRKFKSEFGQEFKARVEARTPVGETGRLSRGWGFTTTKTDIEVFNTVEYAAYVEYGTPKMEPRGMLRATILESEEIAAIAAERAKK